MPYGYQFERVYLKYQLNIMKQSKKENVTPNRKEKEEKPSYTIENSIQDEIAYEKMLLRITEKAMEEAKQYNKFMDSLREKLEANLAQTQAENAELRKIYNINRAEVERLHSQKQSEKDLWAALEPGMKELEKTTNMAVSSKDEYEMSLRELSNAKEKLRMKRQQVRQSEEELYKKKERLTRIREESNEADKQIQRLTKLLSQSEAQNEELFVLRKKLNNELQQIKGNIRVYCRVRPAKSENNTIAVTSDNTLVLTIERERLKKEPQKHEQGFIFEQIFNENENQESIFNELSQLVQSSIDGKNVCIFAYGQTGSGKTYTLLGPEQEGRTAEQIYLERGMVPRSIELVFKKIADSRKFRWNFRTFLSIQEIYLENVIDLIKRGQGAKDDSPEVEVTESQGVFVYLKEGLINRKKAATFMNERSSRSHLIITLRLEGFSERTKQKRNSSLVFVDLAGSQRLSTSRSQSGDLLKETQFINKSLSSLGTVINEMRRGAEHVSYRNSKLTFMLQRYLQGDSKTLMFVNVSPDKQDIAQTRTSLSFAEGVRQCKMKK